MRLGNILSLHLMDISGLQGEAPHALNALPIKLILRMVCFRNCQTHCNRADMQYGWRKNRVKIQPRGSLVLPTYRNPLCLPSPINDQIGPIFSSEVFHNDRAVCSSLYGPQVKAAISRYLSSPGRKLDKIG